MIKGQVCLDEMESGGNKGPKAVLRLKVRSGGRERGLWFQFGAGSAIIGAEFGRHLGNVGLSFLERNSDQIEAAGPLFDSSDDSGAGGLWVVDAESPEAVLALVHEDPFWPTGLRKVVRILNWKQVFSNDQRFFHQ